MRTRVVGHGEEVRERRLPRRDIALIIMVVPDFMAASRAGSSSLFTSQALSPCVNIVKLLLPISTLTEDCSFIG